ncbi:MAG: PAS domain-containing protein [Pirellulales bacterium]
MRESLLETKPSAVKPAGKCIRVLVVDDGSPERQAVLRALVDPQQFDLIQANSPEEVDQLLAVGSVDVVVSELATWLGDELEILDKVRRAAPRARVVIVTSRGNEHWAVEAIKRGAADYIAKTPGYLERLAGRVIAADDERAAGAANGDGIADRQWADLQRDQLFELSMSLLCVGGFDGFMKRCNPGIERMLGYSHEEMMSMPLADLVHPADHQQMIRMAAQLREGQRASAVETRIRTKDGAYKWIMWDAVPCVEHGFYFANGQDITARKLFERQLSESHRRFQLLASATQEAVWDWDLRENRIWQNSAYLQMFGTFDPAVETVVDWWRCRVHPDDRERILSSIPRTAVDGQQKWVLEYRLRRVDGSYAYVYDRGFVIFDEQGQPVRMVGALIDITDLIVTEQKLRESEERFRLAVKATRDAIWDWDRQSDQVWRSTGFQTLFGYKPEEIVPTLAWWIDRIHPDDRERILSQVPSLEAGSQQQCAFEYRFRRADGTYADVIDRGFVMFGPDGTPARMVGSMMDVSERRRAEELTHLHQAEMAHMSRVSTMGEIATGIAHELNQPLTAISNYAESCAQAIASNAKGADEKVLEWIEKIATNTHRAAEMIRRLRGFTRKSEPRRSTVEVGELVREVIDLVEAESRMREVRVRFQLRRKVHATVDRIQIQQVLVNLLRNAYEAMAGVPPQQRQVTITARRLADKVEISVEDAGEGIAPEDLHRVFDAFVTSKPHGVGIGLAISRSIVEGHGGRLWVKANPNRGVTFRFTLPKSGAPDDPITDRFDRR